MSGKIYFDNAATTWPKYPFVKDAVEEFLCRGVGYVNRTNATNFSVDKLRNSLINYFNATDKYDVAFVPSATIGMNIVMKYIKDHGFHVTTTNMEHHSVYRPLNEFKIEHRISNCIKADCSINEDEFLNTIEKTTNAIIINNASNVVGSIINYKYIVDNVNAEILKVLDVSQTAGIEDISLADEKVDVIVGGCHKHFYGLPGLGFILYNKNIKLSPLYYGGTGKRSSELLQPNIYPDMLEAGTQNILAMMVLENSLKYLDEKQRRINREYEDKLLHYFIERCRIIDGIKIYCGMEGKRTSVVSFIYKNLDPNYIIAKYFSQKNIYVRAGLHCSPLIHKTIGTFPTGTVRVSFSRFNTFNEIDRLVGELLKLGELIS